MSISSWLSWSSLWRYVSWSLRYLETMPATTKAASVLSLLGIHVSKYCILVDILLLTLPVLYARRFSLWMLINHFTAVIIAYASWWYCRLPFLTSPGTLSLHAGCINTRTLLHPNLNMREIMNNFVISQGLLWYLACNNVIIRPHRVFLIIVPHPPSLIHLPQLHPGFINNSQFFFLGYISTSQLYKLLLQVTFQTNPFSLLWRYLDLHISIWNKPKENREVSFKR